MSKDDNQVSTRPNSTNSKRERDLAKLARSIGPVLEKLEQRQLLSVAAGNLDSTFNVNGKQTVDFLGGNDVGSALAITSNGDIVVAGSSNGNFAVTLIDPTGAVLSKISTQINGSSSAQINGVAIDNGGNIVVVGQVADGATREDIAVARYIINGQTLELDSSFTGSGTSVDPGSSGYEVTDLNAAMGSHAAPASDAANAVVITPTGDIVVAGETGSGLSEHAFVLAYTSTGSIDGSMFGGNHGIMVSSGPADFANAITLTSTGGVIAAGGQVASGNAELFNPIGSSFAEVVGLGSGASINAITANGLSGNYFVAGVANSAFVLAEVNASGALVSGFGTGSGEIQTSFGSASASANALAVQTNGKIVVAGSEVDGATGNQFFALARYDANGTLDTSFGSAGTVTTDFSGGSAGNVASGVAIQSDGQIVAAGQTGAGMVPDDFAIARYVANNAPVAANTTASLDAVTENITPAGTTVAVLASRFGLTDPDGDSVGLAITAVNDSVGSWQYSTGGNNWTPITGVTVNNALLLAPSDIIRFVPTAGNTGTSSLTAQAWDQTKGSAGNFADIAANAAANYNSFGDAVLTANVLVSPASPPNIVYVSNAFTGIDGSNVTDGFGQHTLGVDAFATIQAAVNAVALNGTVEVDAGTYAENVTINRSMTLLGAQTNADANTRVTAFTGGKADGSVESIITAPTVDPGASAVAPFDDLISVTADNVTINGFTLDGNNAALDQTNATLVNGVAADARRGIDNIDASGNPITISGLTVENNIIQNVDDRGISLFNNGVNPAVNDVIQGNVVRNFANNGIILFDDAYADVQNNTIDVPDNAIGLQLQNFFNTTGTMTWSGNNITVGDGAIGIHVNLFYGPDAVLNISGNQVNAAADAIGDTGLTWGINVWSVQTTATVSLTDNVIGSVNNGGEFDRGMNFWNDPTADTVSVSGGSVADSVIGINVDNVDPYFGGGADTVVDISDVSITGGSVGVHLSAQVLPDSESGLLAGDGATNTVTGNVTADLSDVTISGATTGILVEAPAASSPFTAQVQVSTGTNISSGTTGIELDGAGASIVGNTLADTSLSNESSSYITLSNGAELNQTIDASNVSFDGNVGNSLDPTSPTDLATFYSIENKITDAIDDSTLGVVLLKTGDLFVAQASETPNAGAIQRAVNVAAGGDNIYVQAGLFHENLSINKSVALHGANAGISGASASGVSPTRTAISETEILTNGNQVAVVQVTAANVTIDGFDLEGNDPAVTGSALESGVDSNAEYGVLAGTGASSNPDAVSNLTVENDVIKDVFIGVRGDGVNSTTAVTGGLITDNWFDSIGNFDFGYGVSLRTSFYADITNNLMTRVWTGIHLNDFHLAGGPATWTISGNEIHSYAAGLLYWLQYGSATPLTFENNQISAETGAVANNFGVLITTVQNSDQLNFTGNTITGTDYGIGLTNVSTSNVISFDGTNSIVGAKVAGVYLTDNLNFNPVGTTVLTSDAYTGAANAIKVNIDGMSISTAPGAIGVEVQTSRTSNDVAATANISNDTSITTGGSGTGILVSGANATADITSNDASIFGNNIGIQVTGGSATITGNHIYDNTTGIDFTAGGSGSVSGNNFAGSTDNGTDLEIDSTAGAITIGDGNAFAAVTNYIDNQSSQNFDLSGDTTTTFGGFNAATTVVTPGNLATFYNIEDEIVDAIDQTGLGFIRINPGNVFVTPSSFLDPAADDTGAIERAVAASADGDIINIKAGAYFDNVIVNKSITLDGAGQGLTTIYPAVSNPLGTGSGSLNGGSNIILIQASDTDVENLTIDGNNPNINSGVLSNGVDVDARNGIIADFNQPTSFTGMAVKNVTVQNIYWRGIEYSDGNDSGTGTTDFENDTVTNVDGDANNSIAIFSYGGNGTISNNIVSITPDAISTNWSTGTQILNNQITQAGSGIHSDNNGGLGGVADEIANNTVSLGTANAYGIFVFAPYQAVSVHDNNISGVSVGLAEFGSQTVVAPTIVFQNNTVDLTGVAGGTGAYVTTSLLGFGFADASASFTNNIIKNAATGFDIERDPSDTGSDTASATLDGNTITGNSGDGVYVSGGTGAITGTSSATITDNNISGNGTGIELTSGGAAAVSGNDFTGTPNGTDLLVDSTAGTVSVGDANKFAGTTYIQDLSPQTIDLTADPNTTFSGNHPSTLDPSVPADLATLYGIEDRIVDNLDNPADGYVRIKAGFDFVTQLSENTTAGAVQRAVNDAIANDTVDIAAGNFAGAVSITQNLTLNGAGNGAVGGTTIVAPAAITKQFTTGSGDKFAVIFANADDVTVENLIVNGNASGNSYGDGFLGVAYYNAGGTLDHATIENVENNPLDGDQNGVALYADNADASPRTLNITNDTILNYQKNGMTLVGPNLTLDVATNIVTGAGDTPAIAQNGIEVGDGATGTISGNTVSGNEYSGTNPLQPGGANQFTDVQSTGLLLFGTSGLQVTGNIIDGNDIGIYNNTDDATISSNQLGNTTANRYEGILEDQGSATISGNTVKGGNLGIDVATFDGETGEAASATLDGNTVSGANIGLEAIKQSSGDPAVEVLAQNNNLSGNTEGVFISGGAQVDLGDVDNTNFSGLGTSAGNNILTGYKDAAGQYAIEDENTDVTQPDVYAENDNFGAVSPSNEGVIGQVIFDHNDNPALSTVHFLPPEGVQGPPTTVYVNAAWTGTANGVDADGPTGGALGNGTSFGYDEFSNIQDAVNAIAPNGTVDIYDGTYSQSNIVVSNPMTIHGQDEAGVIVTPSLIDSHDDSSFGGSTASNGFVIAASGVSINNLTIDGGAGQNFRDGIITNSPQDSTTYNDTNIQDVTVDNAYRKGIALYDEIGGTPLVGAPSTGNVIDNNTLDHIGTQLDDYEGVTAIGIFSSNADIENNKITNSAAGIEANDSSVLTISGNNISAPLTVMNEATEGAIGIDIAAPAGSSVISNNIIDLSGAGATGHDIGLIVSFDDTNSVSVSGNTITGAGGDDGILLYQDATPVTLQSNIIQTASNAIDTGVGILLTDQNSDTSRFGDAPGAVSATLLGNSVSDYSTGIELTSSGDAVSAGIGDGTSPNSNTVTGATTGILVSGANSSATINGNSASIDGNNIGIEVTGGTADITGNHIYNNTTGIQIDGNGTATVNSNNFEGTPTSENETDLNLVGGSAPIIGGALTGNTFALGSNNAAYYINNTSSQNLTALSSSNTYNLDGSLQTNNFRIEDAINHAVDNEADGLVTWVANNIYVTAPGSKTINGADTDSSIERGLDVATAGNTVNVEAGTYSQDVNVKKSVTLAGAQAGVAAPGRSGAESIISSPDGTTELQVSVSDVTIDGFTIEGNTSPFVSGAGVYLIPGVSGTHVLNNIIQNNIIGLDLANASATDQAQIEGNLFQNNTEPGASSGTDIYADQFTAGSVLQNVLIENNTFTNSSPVEDSWGVAISNTGTNQFSSLDVEDNTVTNSGRGFYFFNSTNVSVVANTVTGATHYAVGLFGDDSSPGEQGNSSISIRQNTLDNNAVGIEVEDGGDLTSPAFTSGTLTIANNFLDGNSTGVLFTANSLSAGVTVNVNDNHIQGNTTAGLENDSPVTVNADDDYWGSPTGPTNAANPGGTGDVLIDPTVTFSPWLTDGTDIQPAVPGFQPDANVAVGISGSSTGTEGATYTLALTPSSDITGWSINWGDGTGMQPVIGDPANVTHVFAEFGNYTISATAATNSGPIPSNTVTVAVADAALNLTGGVTLSSTEGQSITNAIVATLTDAAGTSSNPSDLSGTIDWGDSTTSTAALVEIGNTGVYNIEGSHTYAEYGTYAISVTINDAGGQNAGPTTSSAAIADAALSAVGTPVTATEGQTLTNVQVATLTDAAGTFSNPGDLSAVINWGDGTATSPADLVENANTGVYTVEGSHTYAEFGNYSIHVTYADTNGNPGGSTTTSDTTASIADAALSLSLNPLSPVEGVLLNNVIVGTLTDGAGIDSNSSDLTTTITWGDGQTSPGTLVEIGNTGVYNVEGTHTYAHSYTGITFQVDVHDAGGQTASQHESINVAFNPPTVDLTGSATSTLVGSTYTLDINAVTDPGPNNVLGYVIDWGDGTVTDAHAGGSPANMTFNHTFEIPNAIDNVIVTIVDSDGSHNAVLIVNGNPLAGAFDVDVNDVPPTATPENFLPTVTVGSAGLVGLTNPMSPSTFETGLGFTYSFDFNNGPTDNGVFQIQNSGTSTATVPASFLSSPGQKLVVMRIQDAFGDFTDYSTDITVNDVAPSVNLGTPNPASATQNTTFTRTGSFTYPGNDAPYTAMVDYDFGAVSDPGFIPLTVNPNNTFTLSNTYNTAGSHTIKVEVTDAFGTTGSATLPVNVAASTFQVMNFTPTASGFDVTFNRPANLNVLNLYSSGSGPYGAPDLTLVGQHTGQVEGSLIWNPSTNTAEFIKTGGVLAADNYTLTLVSGSTAWEDVNNNLLDGLDNSTFANYVTSFTAPAAADVVNLPDFARGPGQAVNTPYTGSTGLPISISNGAGVTSVDFVLNYNPSDLSISNVTLASGLPAGWSVNFSNNASLGQLAISVFGSSSLSSGPQNLVNITSTVPLSATYGASAALNISSLRINEGAIAATAGAAVEKVALLGNASGTGSYDPFDAFLIDNVVVQQLASNPNAGFDAYPLTDPLIVGDATEDGTLSGQDATLVAQEALQLTNVLPAIPVGFTPPGHVPPGTDPNVSIPTGVLANPGTTINLPVSIDDATGLASGLFTLAIDPTKLTLTNVTAGTVDPGFAVFFNPANDEFEFFSTSQPLASGSGTIANLQFTVLPTAASGTAPVSITGDLNGGGLITNFSNGSVNIETPSVANQYVFYNDSKFDGNNAAGNTSDFNAIATDKSALLPGNTATFANYTSYTRGLNGILIDFANLANPAALSASDFQFSVGDNSTPPTSGGPGTGWVTAPTPVSFTTWTGPNGDTFADIIWGDNAIQNQWLQVRVLANVDTHLSSTDVFYFGNAIGSTGVTPASAQVTAADVTATQAAVGPAVVGITNNFDFNRDGRVTAADKTIAQNAVVSASVLQLISIPLTPAIQVLGTAGTDLLAATVGTTIGSSTNKSSSTKTSTVKKPALNTPIKVATNTNLSSQSLFSTQKLDASWVREVLGH
jgi:uncharacterized delta-60 repeat protein